MSPFSPLSPSICSTPTPVGVSTLVLSSSLSGSLCPSLSRRPSSSLCLRRLCPSSASLSPASLSLSLLPPGPSPTISALLYVLPPSLFAPFFQPVSSSVVPSFSLCLWGSGGSLCACISYPFVNSNSLRPSRLAFVLLSLSLRSGSSPGGGPSTGHVCTFIPPLPLTVLPRLYFPSFSLSFLLSLFPSPHTPLFLSLITPWGSSLLGVYWNEEWDWCWGLGKTGESGQG